MRPQRQLQLGLSRGIRLLRLTCVAGALTSSPRLPCGAGPRAASGAGGASEESAGIGTVQALALACGFLFVSLYQGFLSGLKQYLLFGTITGVSDAQVLVCCWLQGSAAWARCTGAGQGRCCSARRSTHSVAGAAGVPVR